MKTVKYALFFILIPLLAGNLFSQKKFQLSNKNMLTPGPGGIVRCAAAEVDAARRAMYPSLGTPEEFEKWLAPKVREYEALAAQGRSTVVITIPIVVHVLHNGETVGTAPNITDAQALSQVTVLNEDFRRIIGTNGHNTHPAGADVDLEFCMATVDPFGNPTSGVNHVNIGQDGVTMDDMENFIKAATIWDPHQYFNLWSVKFVAPDDNLLGYAQFPENSGLAGMPTTPQNALTDGVVIRYQSFGTIEQNNGTFILDAPYDLGRTATHEVGHWVGLRHIWGDGLGCNLGVAPPGCSCAQDDYCEDTPNSDQANYGCPEGKTSPCDLPNLPTLDMIENYMDYSDDPCMNIFTLDQKARIQAVMANSPRRMELINSPACAGPKPYVQFLSAASSVSEGSGCGVQTVAIQVGISSPPSAPAMVTFSLGGTANLGIWNDYTISPETVTFPAGSTAVQTVTLTIYQDSRVEANELVSISIDQVNTTGNALKGLTKQQHLVTIEDDDFPPELAGSTPQVLLFSENFNTLGLGWSQTSMAGGSANWNFGTPPLQLGGNYQAFIARNDLPVDLNLYNYNAAAFAQIESPIINASTSTNITLTFDYSCMGEEGYDFGSLWFSKNGGPWTQFGPAEISNSPLPGSLTIPLPSEANHAAQLRIAFRWDNDDLLGTDPPFSVDNIELRGTAGAPVEIQTDLSSTAEAYMAPNTIAHFYDPESGKIMLTLQNASGYDFGCTTVEVDRSQTSAGSGSVAFNSNQPNTKLAAKTFRITPENNNPPAGNNLAVKLFYKNSEITAWELSTLQSRNNLKLVRVADHSVSSVNPGNAADFFIESKAAVLGNFNGQVTVSASFSSGAGGFGIGIPAGASQAMAGNTGNTIESTGEVAEMASLITSLFPNPANQRVEVSYFSVSEEPVEVSLENGMGQLVHVPIFQEESRAGIDTSDLPEGVYLVVLRQGKEQESKRVVVQH